MRVLLAYDGSANAATAVRAVAGLFPTAQAVVATAPAPAMVRAETVNRILPTLPPADVQRMLGEVQRDAEEEARATAAQGVEQAQAAGLAAEAVLAPARLPAWESLLEEARRLGAEVLACGTRGRGAFSRALLGSTSSALLHHSDLPLLVVPDGGGGLDGPAIAAYDGSEHAARAIAVLGRVLGGRRTVVVHAWESVFHRTLTARALAAGPIDDLRDGVQQLRNALAENAEATAEQGVELARAAGLEAVGETRESTAGTWRTIADAARDHGAAVLVTGARGLGGTRSALLGSVSSGLVHNAGMPVLVVPPAAGASAPRT
jgi:nucleotide-binding universal stress UspA family protein